MLANCDLRWWLLFGWRLGRAGRRSKIFSAARISLFKVLLHNDDYTTMEFVVHVLQSVFNHEEALATQIMLHVHSKGIGVAGVYPHEVAETKIEQVHALAREYEFPLRCSMEEA